MINYKYEKVQMTKQQTRAVTTIMDVAVNVAMGTIELRTIGALIIRLRFWGPLYYNYNKEPPK